jgi:hypothetical protein
MFKYALFSTGFRKGCKTNEDRLFALFFFRGLFHRPPPAPAAMATGRWRFYGNCEDGMPQRSKKGMRFFCIAALRAHCLHPGKHVSDG